MTPEEPLDDEMFINSKADHAKCMRLGIFQDHGIHRLQTYGFADRLCFEVSVGNHSKLPKADSLSMATSSAGLHPDQLVGAVAMRISQYLGGPVISARS
jgi:hypothetical protein